MWAKLINKLMKEKVHFLLATKTLQKQPVSFIGKYSKLME